jgi:hypothetical protein
VLDVARSPASLQGVVIRCQSQPAAVMVARPIAIFANFEVSDRVGGTKGPASRWYVSARSEPVGLGRIRRSGTGTHREMYVNESEAHIGQVCASWTSSQSRQTRATRSCTMTSVCRFQLLPTSRCIRR